MINGVIFRWVTTVTVDLNVQRGVLDSTNTMYGSYIGNLKKFWALHAFLCCFKLLCIVCKLDLSVHVFILNM